MKLEKKELFQSIVIPLAVGTLAGLLTADSVREFAGVDKPPFSPPGFLFPVVWSLLYLLMGISVYLIIRSDAGRKQKTEALSLYGAQLAVNFIWPFLFFNLGFYLLSFVWLLLLWVLVFSIIRSFSAILEPAAYLNIPYLIWLTFAGYLNLGVFFLNR